MSLIGRLDAALPDRAPWSELTNLGGSSRGAAKVCDVAGTEQVVKFHPYLRASAEGSIAAGVQALRGRGVPAPLTVELRSGEGVLLLMEPLPGQPHLPLSVGLVEHALDLNRLQVGAGVAGDWTARWSAVVRDPAAQARLRAHSTRSESLLAALLSLAGELEGTRLPGGDLMHQDFHAGNILTLDGQRVTGIVDWDNIASGDHLVDVAHLGLTSQWRSDEALIARIWQQYFAAGDRTRRAACMTYTVMRVLDWMVTHTPPKAAEMAVGGAERSLARLVESGV